MSLPLPLVVLDACVLANFALCDTLLRLAETPKLIEPRWSEEIIAETVRTLNEKLSWPDSLTTHFEAELRSHFSDAWVRDFEPLVSWMTNDKKDRHVVAAAVRADASFIVTLNLRHFRVQHLEPWGLVALHPQTFLRAILRQDPTTMLLKLEQQAADRGRTLNQLLAILHAVVPEFSAAAASLVK